MLKLAVFTILIALLVLSLACGDGPSKPGRTPTSGFPLTTDSRWVYDGFMIDYPFNDSALADTIRREISRHVIGPDTAFDIAGLVALEDTIITTAADLIDTSIARYLVKIDNGRLKEYAADIYNPGSEPHPLLNDQPGIWLDFPLSNGKGWLCWSHMQGSKSSFVAGTEYLDIMAGYFLCDVVSSHISDVMIPNPNVVISFYDWYTDDGLMKSQMDFGVHYVRDEFGNLIDSVRTVETWNLMEKQIQSEL